MWRRSPRRSVTSIATTARYLDHLSNDQAVAGVAALTLPEVSA
jgi:hypothetical protein